MIKQVLATALLALATSGLAACGNGGTVARTPDQYKTDMTAIMQTKTPQLRACYDSSRAAGDVKGKATLHFEIQTYFKSGGGAVFGKGELGDPKQGSTSIPKSEGSSVKLNKCVYEVVSKIVMEPLDKKYGMGDWTLVFDPDTLDPTAPVPTAPAAAATPAPAQ
ncbi:MAG: hypothetical protein EOO75_04745 [Myxococcales bacterium]|nr:MAG: hypothetical protein EOO75_04745 [Myxococcales bacterium]